MAHYIARVELRGDPAREVYEKLHALMARNGFTQSIKGIAEVTGKPVGSVLPHATYAGESTLQVGELRNSLAKQIIQSIQPNIAMLVVRYDKWATYPVEA